MIKAVILDFDGVIIDSNNAKTDAFVKLFDAYPASVKEAIRKFHLQNGGMSRFDKFRHIYAGILKERLSDKKFEELCDNFRDIVLEGVMAAPIIDGVEGFLKKNKDNYGMYIVSGTPQEEIRMIAKRRKLDKYFRGIYGAPQSKKDLIKQILKGNGYDPKEAVFLGDSVNDYEGAAGAGVEFVAKISDGLEVELFPNIRLQAKIKTMEEFERYLDRKNGVLERR